MPNPSLKVLIIGAGGRLGAALHRRLQSRHSVTALRREDLDVSDLSAIQQTVQRLDFDILFYTAGNTNVDDCEMHPENANLCNHLAPALLAEICLQKAAKLVHISTDYVFDGHLNRLLKESDRPNPLSCYGNSKLLGEKAVLSISEDNIVARVSWLFGPDRPSFPDMILRHALQSHKVSAIADKFSSPTYSEDLCAWLEPMMHDTRYKGLLHLCNQGQASWLEYAEEVLNIAQRLQLPIQTTQVTPLSRQNFSGFKAVRPQYTAFDTSKFNALSATPPAPWQDALARYLCLQYETKITV